MESFNVRMAEDGEKITTLDEKERTQKRIWQ